MAGERNIWEKREKKTISSDQFKFQSAGCYGYNFDFKIKWRLIMWQCYWDFGFCSPTSIQHYKAVVNHAASMTLYA